MTEPVRPLEALIAEKIAEWNECANFEAESNLQYAQALSHCADELAALLQAAAPPAPQEEQRIANLEWVLKRAEEIVRDEHGRDAAYAFTQAWLELPDPDELSAAAPPAPTAELDEHRRLKYSQMDLDAQTKPLHVEIERLRAAPPERVSEGKE